MVARSSGTASVVAYNYFDEALISNWGQPSGCSNPNGTGCIDQWIEVHANASHMVGSHHVLFEGNYAANFDSDHTHGNSTYMTTLRNYFKGWRTPFHDPCYPNCPPIQPPDPINDPGSSPNGPTRAHGPSAFGYWFASVANVLGVQGQSGWTYEDNSNTIMANGTLDIFALGWDDFQSAYGPYCPNGVCVDKNVACPGGTCPNPGLKILRDGSFDWQTCVLHWDTPGSPAIPNSFITNMPLNGPAFWPTQQCYHWPWVTPNQPTGNCSSATNQTYTNPAKRRWDNGTPFTQPTTCQ